MALPEDIQQWLRTAPEITRYLGRAELDAVVDEWQQQNVTVRVVGSSRRGKYPIRMASFGQGGKNFLAWGYPHPDEPLGAQALVWFGNSLLDGSLLLPDWTVHLILCADPEGVEYQTWLDKPLTCQNFVRGLWRPTHVGLEVDYGFPLDRDLFWMEADYQGRCRLPGEKENTYSSAEVFGPLPESLALARAIDFVHPDVVGLMHGTHSGGDYTFTLTRPEDHVLDELENIPSVYGLQRHLGVPIDRGRSWRRRSPDIIVERDFEWFARRIRRLPDYNEEMVYLGCHSAAVYAETDAFYQGKTVQVITPETTQFRHPWFGSRQTVEEKEQVLVSVENRPHAGRCRVVRTQTATGWQIAALQPTNAPLHDAYETEENISYASLGVQAVALRKLYMLQAQSIWQGLQGANFVYHPFVDEAARARFRCEGEGWLLPLRSQERFHRPCSRAEYACWRWLWPLHTATLLGNFHSWLDAQDQELEIIQQAIMQIEQMQDDLLALLPEEMRIEGPRAPALSSAMARILLFLQ